VATGVDKSQKQGGIGDGLALYGSVCVQGIIFRVRTLAASSSWRSTAGAVCAVLVPLVACTYVWLTTTAGATPEPEPTAKLSAALTPERLGRGTTIIFGFTIATTTGQVPSPLTALNLYYPNNLGLGTSGLGLETCSAATLEVDGPEGCPSQSQMGYGKGLVEIPFGPEILQETTQTMIFMAHVHEGRLGLLFYANGHSPVSAQIVFHGLVLPANRPFGGDLATTIPLVTTLPGAPNAAVVQLRSTIGPLHLTYYEHTRGRYRPYHPRGIVLPRTCPHGGFRFAASFSFEDGTQTSAHTTVPCPQ
jgi:hypothetical protein